MHSTDDYKCKLDKDALLYCEEILKESEEKKIEYIGDIRTWLDENKHLNAYTDTFNILRFLRVSKYNLDVAKKKINTFYSFKTTAPEWFENRDPLLPELQSLLKTGVFLPLLKRDHEGRLVVIIRTAAHDPAIQKQNDVFKIGLMTLDLALLEEDTTVYGVAAIFDMEGISLAHAKALHVKMIKKAVTSWQIYPVRVKRLDFVNSPSYINAGLNIFRAFMTQKIKDRVYVHGSSRESLHSIVPKEILPEEYGGTSGKLQDLIDYWHKKVTDSRDWFIEDEKHKGNLPP